LKCWAKSLKSPSSRRIEAHEALEIHQLALEESDVTQTLISKESNLQKELHRACRLEEEYWRQNSRIFWLQARDKNTSYFHKQAETRKHFKYVNEIQLQDQTVKDFEGIKKDAHSFFKDLYTTPEEIPLGANSYPLDLIPHLIHEAENMNLTAPIS